jgi:hypothetical protein
MQELAITGGILNGVADGVTEIEGGPQARLGLVLADDLGLDGAAAGDDRQRIEGCFSSRPSNCFSNRWNRLASWMTPYLTISEMPERSSRSGSVSERVQIAQDQPWLMEGADAILAGLQVDPDFAPDRTVDLGQQRGGHLHKRDAPQVGSPPRTRPDPPPPHRRGPR